MGWGGSAVNILSTAQSLQLTDVAVNMLKRFTPLAAHLLSNTCLQLSLLSDNCIALRDSVNQRPALAHNMVVGHKSAVAAHSYN